MSEHRHTNECLAYAAKTGKAFCIAECKDSGEAIEREYAAIKRENKALKELVDYIDSMALFMAAGELPRTATTRAQHLRVIARKVDTLLTAEEQECEHSNAVSAINEVVKSGYFCPDCNGIFADDPALLAQEQE